MAILQYKGNDESWWRVIKILYVLKEKHVLCAPLVDLSNAFYSISHSTIFDELHTYWLDIKDLKLFRSHLKVKKQ